MIDIHQHPDHFGKSVADILAHTQGLGGGISVVMPVNNPKPEVSTSNDDCRQAAEKHPEALVWFFAVSPEAPDAPEQIERRTAEGAWAFGEHKYPLPCDHPKSMEIYRLCGELGLPVLLHFEDANYNTGFANFEKVLKACPDTVFIGHAQTWWANIGAADAGRSDYPKEPVKPGGLTDRLLSDHANLYADLSAGSGLNACERDPEFYRAFIERHHAKMLFGTDCPCRDGHGAGWSQAKCFGEKMLARLKELCPSDDIYLDITENNARRLLGIVE